MGQLLLKKDIVPAFKDDVKASLKSLQRVEEELGARRGLRLDSGHVIDLGFEIIVRYKDLTQLTDLAENLKACEGLRLSLHAPYNLEDPATVDLTTSQGYEVALRLLEFAVENGIDYVCAHPNVMRPGFSNWSVEERHERLERLVEAALKLNKVSDNVLFAIENKPVPAANYSEGRPIFYAPLMGPFAHLEKVTDRGLPLVFDTAHYAITRASIHGRTSAQAWKQPVPSLDEGCGRQIGLFEEDLVVQPTVPEVLERLGKQIIGIHLNDATPYYTPVRGTTMYWEGLVPGRGGLVSYTDVVRFIRKHPEAGLSVVMEVVESDYQKCPNTHECFKGFLCELQNREP